MTDTQYPISAQVLDQKKTESQALKRMGRLSRWRKLLREDIETIYAKDPAARSMWEVLTCYPGLHASWLHRIAHELWKRNRLFLARMVSHFNRFVTGVEIHPGARIGRRFFIDHGSGVVIGETSEIGDDVLMYQGAVLGGTSPERTKRHPTVGDGVVIGANAVMLGNITIGDRVKVGSGSVVVKSVPADATVVGVPGRITRINGRRPEQRPRNALDHANLPDPVVETLKCMVDRLEFLEKEVRDLRKVSIHNLDEQVVLDSAWLSESMKE